MTLEERARSIAAAADNDEAVEALALLHLREASRQAADEVFGMINQTIGECEQAAPEKVSVFVRNHVV